MSYDLIVIGTGLGGYVCAIRAAQLGLKTAVVEKRKTQGGTCLNVGCIPSKALLHASHAFEDAKHHFGDLGIQVGEATLDLSKMMAFKDEGVEGNVKGVEFLLKKTRWTCSTARRGSRPWGRSRLWGRMARTRFWKRKTSSSRRARTWRRCPASTSTRQSWSRPRARSNSTPSQACFWSSGPA